VTETDSATMYIRWATACRGQKFKHLEEKPHYKITKCCQQFQNISYAKENIVYGYFFAILYLCDLPFKD
jgi:hypothetical protein